MGIIYKVTCIATTKIYIGKTSKTLNERRKQHYYLAHCYNEKYHTYFLRALQKYSPDTFIWEILEEVEEKLLSEREKHYIRVFNSNNNIFGYNLTEGGEGVVGRSKEVLLKMSEFFKGRVFSEDHKKKIGEKTKERLQNEEYKERWIDSIKEATSTKEYKEKQSKSHKGKKLSEDTKKKISKSRKNMNKGISSPYNKKVRCIETGIEYFSILNASECTNINNSNIGACCKGKRKTAGGFHWEIING
jgi:group I intron endonuclease